MRRAHIRAFERPLEGFRQSEIEHLYRAVGPELDVGRLQVAMNDVLFVSGIECECDLACRGNRRIEPQRSLRDSVRQGRPFHQFEHEGVQAFLLFDTVDGGDIG